MLIFASWNYCSGSLGAFIYYGTTKGVEVASDYLQLSDLVNETDILIVEEHDLLVAEVDRGKCLNCDYVKCERSVFW